MQDDLGGGRHSGVSASVCRTTVAANYKVRLRRELNYGIFVFTSGAAAAFWEIYLSRSRRFPVDTSLRCATGCAVPNCRQDYERNDLQSLACSLTILPFDAKTRCNFSREAQPNYPFIARQSEKRPSILRSEKRYRA